MSIIHARTATRLAARIFAPKVTICHEYNRNKRSKWKFDKEFIPARQICASEQLFSIAGLFYTEWRGQLNTETFELLTLQKVNQDILENEDMSDVSEDENSVDDPDPVGNSEEGASDLSDGEDEEQFLNCFEDSSDSSSEESAADDMEDDAE